MTIPGAGAGSCESWTVFVRSQEMICLCVENTDSCRHTGCHGFQVWTCILRSLLTVARCGKSLRNRTGRAMSLRLVT